ncbi:porin family protein [Polaribacter porphyrae]|uniref:Outer membrane protein beta-barrel domain-containing protein n=1 Tax=Polaribacter porphyrae TaxID=1137780 RepID=A0A2S7WP44_9FLAO|nr:porin family protein [Polaribacter porphyrae]PQJ79226.1 hypothetical protein BTO18_08600 [Polaribacter porphyrae]
MKKLVLTAFAVCGLLSTNAQEVKFGIKGGLNLSEINWVNSKNKFRTTDFNAGFMAEISLSEKFSIQPELLFSGQGGSSINLSYLNLPVMGKYYVTESLSLEAGPQIGYLLSAKTGGRNVKSSFNKFDFGANFGLGYKLNNGLNFGVRYNLGLTKVNKTSTASEFSNMDNRNQVFQVSIGYFFF